MALSNILIPWNTDIPASLVDAQTYIAQRGLPENLLGLNFGIAAAPVDVDSLFADIFVQSLVWDGAADTFQDGAGAQAALRAIHAKYALDGLIQSTYTPIVLDLGGPLTTLPGWLAAYTHAGGDVLPNGRLGCPASAADSFNFNTEMVGRSGIRVFEQALTNAMAAEQRYNKNKPLWGTTASTGDAFGFTDAYNAASLSEARAAGCNITVDIATNYPNFVSGTQSATPDLFGFCCSENLNTAGTPGSQVYSDHYTALSGAWWVPWYSYQWYSGMDALYNGASCAMMSVSEPFADGCRDPALVLQQLLTGTSLMECLPISATPDSSPVWPVASFRVSNLTVLGDPLYSPYKKQTPDPVAAPPPWGMG